MTKLSGKDKKEEPASEDNNSNIETAMNSDDLNVSMISDDSSLMNQSINQDDQSAGLSQTKSTSQQSDGTKASSLF